MNLTTKTSHVITFTVEAFWNEEGGMGSDTFGEPTGELPVAVRTLELARISGGIPKGVEWVIVADVKSSTVQS